MLLSAAAALAGCVSDEQLNATYIVPSVFDANVHTAVAAAVREAAGSSEIPSRSKHAGVTDTDEAENLSCRPARLSEQRPSSGGQTDAKSQTHHCLLDGASRRAR